MDGPPSADAPIPPPAPPRQLPALPAALYSAASARAAASLFPRLLFSPACWRVLVAGVGGVGLLLLPDADDEEAAAATAAAAKQRGNLVAIETCACVREFLNVRGVAKHFASGGGRLLLDRKKLKQTPSSFCLVHVFSPASTALLLKYVSAAICNTNRGTAKCTMCRPPRQRAKRLRMTSKCGSRRGINARGHGVWPSRV